MSHDKTANNDLNLLYGDNFFIFLHVFLLLEFYWLSNMMKNMWSFLLATLEAVFLWFQYAISSHNFSKKLIFKHWNIFGCCCCGNKALNEIKKKTSFILIFRNSLLNFKNNGRHILKELNTNIADFLSKGENPQTVPSLRLKDCSDNVTLLIVHLKTTTNGVKIRVYCWT